MALKEYSAAARTAVIIARDEQNAGEKLKLLHLTLSFLLFPNYSLYAQEALLLVSFWALWLHIFSHSFC